MGRREPFIGYFSLRRSERWVISCLKTLGSIENTTVLSCVIKVTLLVGLKIRLSTHCVTHITLLKELKCGHLRFMLPILGY